MYGLGYIIIHLMHIRHLGVRRFGVLRLHSKLLIEFIKSFCIFLFLLDCYIRSMTESRATMKHLKRNVVVMFFKDIDFAVAEKFKTVECLSEFELADEFAHGLILDYPAIPGR